MRIYHSIRKQGSIWELLADAIAAYRERTQVLNGEPPIGETSVEQKLQAIIDMLGPLGLLPSTVGLMETRLETIHEMIVALSTDPEKIAEIAAKVKAAREKLQTSVDQQKEN